MKPDFDVIVVGSGMVGASAALSLAQKGFSVALVERQSLKSNDYKISDQVDNRVSAISPSSQALLNQLGVWQEVHQLRACDYTDMQVWHENGAAQMHFSCNQLGVSHLGTIVENRLIQSLLLRALEIAPSVEFFAQQNVVSLAQDSDSVTVQTSEGKSISAQLLLAADGRQSAVRDLAHMSAFGGSYKQRAIVANVQTELDHQHTAWQRFLSTGPLAFLPLSNGQSSIVWSADESFAGELMSLSDDDFNQALSEAFEFRLGSVLSSTGRAAFPLGWHAAEQWLNGRVLLLGDAAHSVHPLAGQGVNLGFDDVTVLSRIIQTGGQVYNHRKLRQFERQRKAETQMATHLFSALKMIYGQNMPFLNTLRDKGMSLVEKNQMIKRLVMQSAVHNMA